MKRRIGPLALCAAAVLVSCAAPEPRPQAGVDMDFDWKFTLGDPALGPDPGLDDSGWRTVNLPHDWSVESAPAETNPSGTAGGYFAGGVGWYRKSFRIPGSWRGKTLTLVLGGVSRNSTVWMNGRKAGGRASGYVSFLCDLTPFARPDTVNVIAVRADASVQPYDRWYSGAGIYRSVRLEVRDPVHVPVWGVAVTTPSAGREAADVGVRTRVRNGRTEPVACRVTTTLLDPAGRRVAEGSTETLLPPSAEDTVSLALRVRSPRLWSPGRPGLYRARTAVSVAGRTVDESETPFGIRSVRFSPDSGFILNGAKTLLKGVCLHHDGGCTGAAVPLGVWERRLETLRSLGVNALRLAHNPHAAEVLDLCDRMGLLVFDELVDKWALPWQEKWWPSLPQPAAAFARDFHAEWRADLRDFIDRDRNHPSVVVWSVGNETIEQISDPARGRTLLDSLLAAASALDPTREATCALHPGTERDGHEAPSRFVEGLRVVSYNYRTGDLAGWRGAFPGRSWISSETKAYREDAPADWGRIDFTNNSWFDLGEFTAGQFIWAGIDYLGETRGWPDKGIRTGILSSNGWPKPYAGYTQGLYAEGPVLRLAVKDDSRVRALNGMRTWQASWYGPPVADHWTFPGREGREAEVFAFTNCESAELFLNGESLGEKRLSDFPDRALRWTVPYAPGTLSAVGRNRGREAARHSLSTAGPARRIALEPDRRTLRADGRAVSHVWVRVTDGRGLTVPQAGPAIRFALEGPGRFLGADNGDMADPAAYADPVREPRDGRLLVLVQSTREPGRIRLSASAEGFEPAAAALRSR